MSDFARLEEIARAAGIAVNAPSSTVAPAVTPLAAAAGDTLSCTTGAWNYSPANYAYSWQHADDPAEIGSGDTYTTVQQDAGTSVQCVVTATNGAGATSVPSNSVVVTKQLAAQHATTTVSVTVSRETESRRK